MKSVIKTGAVAAVLTLGLAACDGPNEEAMSEAGEERAEIIEERTDELDEAGMITEEAQDEIIEQAENTADAMEEQGEAMDAMTDQ
jgi:hypothetical protein